MSEAVKIKIIKWLLAASFFAPLLVLSGFYFPYIVPKTLMFQTLIELALFFYIQLAAQNRAYAPKMDLLSKSILAFFGVYALAAIFGENPFRSFFGNYERMLGVFNLAHFVALFFMVRSFFSKEAILTSSAQADRFFIFRWFLVGGFLVGLYGVGQKFGLSFLYNTGAARIDSTIGNAAFFAAYMMFNAFFAIFMLVKDKTSKSRYFYASTLFLSLVSLYLSETRGAILGLFLAALFLAAAFYFEKGKAIFSYLNPRKNIYAKLALVGFLIFFIFAFFNQETFLGPLKRIGSISLSDPTTKTRLLSFGVSWQGVKEHPFLGFGPENYNLVFDKHYNPALYPTEIWFDHAHNIIFDTLISAGAFGLLSYLSIFVISFYLLLRYKRQDPKNAGVAYIFMALLIAYFFQNLFVFDSLATYMSFFLLLAFISSLDLSAVKEKIARPKELPSQAVALAAVLFLFFIYFFNVRPALASYYCIQALASYPKEAIYYFEKSFDTALMGNPEARSKLVSYSAGVARRQNISNSEKRALFDFAESELEKSIKEEPKNVRYYLFLMNMAEVDMGNKDFIKKAESFADKAIGLAPQSPMVYIQMYDLKQLAGKPDEALGYLKKAVEISGDPDLKAFLMERLKKE